MKPPLKPTDYLFYLLLVLLTNLTMAQRDNSLLGKAEQLMLFDTVNQSEVLVLGTHHFTKEVLSKQNQNDLLRLTKLLARFQPTKVVLEWEPKKTLKTNTDYQTYLEDSTFIDNKYNEIFQLGFRLAKMMNHDSVYFFDDQTEFIGSLEGFSFESFGTYAEENDKGFYDKYISEIGTKYQYNQDVLKQDNVLNEILLRNSPKAQKFNAERMHSLEVRVGIQESWIGPDWLGRWYRRNIRMMSNVLKMSEPEDRILIIVGDNHKWTLDMLFKNTPDFHLVSSWEFLLKNDVF